MSTPAIDAREISGLLLEDRALLQRWKAASQAGQIQSVSFEGRHLAVIRDAPLIEHLRTHHPSLRFKSYDEETGQVS